VQQVTNRRRIVIDDDDDWPLPCPKPDADGKHSTMLCLKQCVSEGAVVPTIGTSASEALPSLQSEVSGGMSLLDGTGMSLLDRADKLLPNGAVTADVVQASGSITPKLLKTQSGREVQALRTLGLLKEEDSDNGRSSRRAYQQIQRWVAASAAVAVEVDEPLSER
jgi:hypothetical protein